MRKRLVGTDHHNDEAFLDLSRDARLVYLHLITHPQMTSLGLLRMTVGGLADECDLDRQSCDVALRDLAAIGRIEVGKRCVALSADYLEEPANPSVVMGWGRIIDLLPSTDLVRRRVDRAVSMVRERAEQVGTEKSAAWLDAIPEAMARLADEASDPRTSGARAPGVPDDSGVRYLDAVAPAAMRVSSVSDTVSGTVSETVPDTVVGTLFETPVETVSETPVETPVETSETLMEPSETADNAAPTDDPPKSLKRPSHGVLDGVQHPVGHGVRDGVGHGVGDSAGHGVGDGVGHGVGDGVAHGVGDGVGHSIFHLPSSNIQIPTSEKSRQACSDAGACAGAGEDADGWPRELLLRKAAAVVRRQLEVSEIEMVDSWIADGIPSSLIDAALADGLRTTVHRLKWVDLRLRELERGHLHQHPELDHDDFELEKEVALKSLANDEISGHLSDDQRRAASAAVHIALTAGQVRRILDRALGA